MSQSLGELYDGGDLARTDAVDRAPAPGDAQREITELRSLNAHLTRQLGLLAQREARARQLADRDGLTGLYNQRRMRALLEDCIDAATQHGHRVGVLFVDLDGFKLVNDRFGHLAGDELLSAVAARIAGRARAGDFVCRYGGDEFVVILPRVSDPRSASRLAADVRERLSHPYWIGRRELRLTAAIGVALYPDGAGDAAGLLRAADESMYRAKCAGAEAPEGCSLCGSALSLRSARS